MACISPIFQARLGKISAKASTFTPTDGESQPHRVDPELKVMVEEMRRVRRGDGGRGGLDAGGKDAA